MMAKRVTSVAAEKCGQPLNNAKIQTMSATTTAMMKNPRPRNRIANFWRQCGHRIDTGDIERMPFQTVILPPHAGQLAWVLSCAFIRLTRIRPNYWAFKDAFIASNPGLHEVDWEETRHSEDDHCRFGKEAQEGRRQATHEGVPSPKQKL